MFNQTTALDCGNLPVNLVPYSFLIGFCSHDPFYTSSCISFSDIVNGDLKSTLRVLYTLFTKYKNQK